MDELSRDFRHAARALRRDRRFTILVVLTLAIGIGANAGVFSIFHAVLLTPPPYPDSERLVVLWSEIPSAGVQDGTSALGNVEDWRERSDGLESLAAWDPITLTMTGPDVPDRLSAARVTASFFDVLRVLPEIGRAFIESEAARANRLVIASQAFAIDRYGSTEAALGRSITLDGQSFEIVGVMPAGFAYPDADTRLWLPWSHFGSGEAEATARGAGPWRVLGRLRDDVSLEAARADLRALAAELEGEHAANAGLGIRAVPLHEQQIGASRRAALWTSYGAVGLILLIACANAAHLLLIRGVERSADRAIRTALGASQLSLVRQALAENLILALLAGVVGVVVAAWSIALLTWLAPPNLFIADVRAGPVTVAYAAALSSLIGIAFGIAPAFRGSRSADRLVGARVIAPRAGPSTRRGLLVTGQLALALMLVFGSTLLVRSLIESASVDPGFEPDGVYLANLSVPAPEGRVAFYEGVVESVSEIPGVEAAGIIEDVFIGGAPTVAVTVDGGAVPAGPTALRVDAIAGEVFAAMGAELSAGRSFTSADGADASPVAIVNETMARRFWPGESPVGRRFRTGEATSDSPWVEVVGVVGDMRRQGVELEPIAQVFRPYAQAPSRNMNLLVRADLTPDVLQALLGQRLAAVDRSIPLYGISTLSQGMGRYVAQRRAQTFLLGAFSSVALIMAAVGMYGVLHHSVSKRSKEIGVRVALGAHPVNVVRMVLREGLALALPGIAIGIVGALWMADVLSSLLYRVSTTDVASIVVTALTLTAATLAASYLPARRAARVDPNHALRGD